MSHVKSMALKKGRYAGLVRPFVVLTPEEDKKLSHAAIDQSMGKSEFIKKALLYCLNHKIDLSKEK